MKTTKKHFEIFKRVCLKYFKEWQLDDWDVYFEHVDLKDSRARINITHNARMVEISLSTTWDQAIVDKKSLEAVAKHEVLHALLGPITTLTRSRCVISLLNKQFGVSSRIYPSWSTRIDEDRWSDHCTSD